WRESDTKTREAFGKILVEADDGGLLLLGQDGRLWTIEKAQLVSRKDTGNPFRPLSSAALAKELPAELGRGFEVVETKHYIIATSARREYAEWCGTLFERLYLSFHKFWKKRGVNLTEPEFPLV